MNNPQTPRNHDNQIIDLVPADSIARGFASSAARRIERLVTGTFKIAIFLLVALVVVRMTGILFFRNEITGGVERISTVGGFSEGVSSWLTGSVTFIIAIAAFGFVARLVLAFLLPAAIGGAGLWRPALLLLALTGLNALAPEGIKAIRGVDDSGLAARMTEIDPASSLWFDPAGNALLFFADHLDGERRFWDRPGHTPEDAALAHPVTEEVRRAWLERRRRDVEQARLREDRQAEEARLKAARNELEDLKASLEREKAAWERDRQPSVPSSSSLAGKPSSSAPMSAPAAPVAIPRAVPVSPPTPGPDRRFELAAGKTLALELGGRSVECWADGSVELWTENVHGATRPVLSPLHRRRLDRTDTVYVKPVNGTATRLSVRWLDGNAPVSTPLARLIDPSPMPSPRQLSSLPTIFPAAPVEPPVQSIPIGRGRVTYVNVHGDTVECWSDGPVSIVGDRNSGPVRQLRAGEKIRISGSDRVNVTPTGHGATRLFIQTVTPNLDRFRDGRPGTSSSATPDFQRFARF